MSKENLQNVKDIIKDLSISGLTMEDLLKIQYAIELLDKEIAKETNRRN